MDLGPWTTYLNSVVFGLDRDYRGTYVSAIWKRYHPPTRTGLASRRDLMRVWTSFPFPNTLRDGFAGILPSAGTIAPHLEASIPRTFGFSPHF